MTDIMTAPTRPVIDVRDMLCAQAIMVTTKAATPLAPGTVFDVVCNAADVQQDLLLWAKEVAFAVLDVAEHEDAIRLTLKRNERDVPGKNR